MAKKVFAPFEGTVDADDLNGWQHIRYDILGDPATPAEAIAFLGVDNSTHTHPIAVPSVNGVGGSAGFISAQLLEKFIKATSFPASVQIQVPAGAVFLMMKQNGEIQGITISSLADILGSTGPGPGTSHIRDGGESGGTVSSVLDGGESGGTINSTRDGGESGGTINV